MTNQQIIITIAVALISTFAKLIFEKILTPYIPERKKLSSYIKKFFFFIIAYIFPMATVICLMIVIPVVSKYFVIAIVFNFFALSINLSIYYYRSTYKTFGEVEYAIKQQIGINKDQLGLHDAQNDLNKIHDKRMVAIESELLKLKNQNRKK